jgi:hypothetical protein
MSRGRTPSKSDEKAIAAVAAVRAFLQETVLSPTALAGKLDISASAVLRALNADPPTWTPTLKKLNIFVNSQYPTAHGGSNALEHQFRALRGAGSASATAAVLRALANLLDSEAVG